MSITCIESVSKEALEAFQKTEAFSELLKPGGAEINHGTEELGLLDEAGNRGPVHWVLVRDTSPEDNATFRLSPEGELTLWHTGVEV